MDKAGQRRRAFYGLWVVAGCFVLLFLFAGAGFYSFSIFIDPLEKEFGWNRSQISGSTSWATDVQPALASAARCRARLCALSASLTS